MTRFIFSLLLLPFLLHGATSVDGKIKKTSANINQYEKDYASLQSRLQKTARDILKRSKTIKKQQREIKSLQIKLEQKETIYQSAKLLLSKLSGSQEKLQQSQNALKSELSELLGRTLSLTILHDTNRSRSSEGIIAETIFQSLNEQTRQRILVLSRQYEDNRDSLRTLTGRTAQLQNEINEIENQHDALRRAKAKNEKSLASLKRKKEGYRKNLKELIAQKDELERTLRQLNIIKRSEEERARAEAERKANEARLASTTVPKVKHVGSSYHKAKTGTYRGAKTIAPLDGYSVLKKFGTYTDPVYQIKIFNESVTLRSKAPNAKVRAVLNGKVVLAQKTAMLNNVIILEHDNGLHTIYAHLDQIAPTVTRGKRIRKGSVIGRIDRDLMFEVTQKNLHIDPLQMIQ